MREMEITMEVQKKGKIYPDNPHWREMYKCLEDREERRRLKPYKTSSRESSSNFSVKTEKRSKRQLLDL